MNNRGKTNLRSANASDNTASKKIGMKVAELSSTRISDMGDAGDNEWIKRTHESLLKALDLSRVISMPNDKARVQIRDAATKLLDDANAPLSASTRQRVVKGVENEILGHGPLEPLLEDPSVSDILVNRYDSVYVERGGKLEKTAIQFRDDQHLLTIIDRIVSNVGRRVDESSPMVDARLADGSRVNAIIPPLALDGPAMSIRRFKKDKLSTDDLINIGSMNEAMAEVLAAIVKAQLNIVVSGGTGTGKTTILNILSSHIGSTERIITIEDSAELQLQQPHVVRLETRPQNIEGKGEISQRELVKNSLRMRPDRVIIGEVRGGEALDMLQAMNTGHDGSLATLHANTPRDAISRLENMVSMAGLKLPMSAMRSQIASAVDVILQLERMEDGTRRITSITEIQGMEGDVITMSEIFTYARTGLDEDGNVLGYFTATGVVPNFYEKLKQRGSNMSTTIFQEKSALRKAS